MGFGILVYQFLSNSSKFKEDLDQRANKKKTLQFSERSILLIHISKTIFHKDEKDTKKIGIGQPK